MEFVTTKLALGWIGLALFLGMAAAARIGNALRTRWHDTDHDAEEGYLLSAALALLGLLIAFTFSLAVSRYDGRRELVVREANAIGTAWLRAGVSGDAAGRDLQKAIAAYADVRLGLSRLEPVDQVEAVTAQQQVTVWRKVQAVVAVDNSAVAASTMAAVNEMFDAAGARKAERSARIPGEVLLVLMAYAVIAAGIVGYVLGAQARQHRMVTAILFLLLTMAITLILDLDRPRSGAITVSQQPMWDVRAAIRP